jgi:hypothetical protein
VTLALAERKGQHAQADAGTDKPAQKASAQP